jgi:hypothetical protein
LLRLPNGRNSKEESETSDNTAEYIGDGWTQQGQNDDDDYGNKHQDQCIFHKALTMAILESKHNSCPFTMELKKS